MKIFNNSKNKKIKLSNIISQSNIFLLHNINNKRQLLNKVSKILEDQTNFSKEAILDLLLKKENNENTLDKETIHAIITNEL